MVTLRQVVEELRGKGAKVTYRKRKDGSIVVKSINGVKYKGREGNEMARVLTGKPLSQKQYAQRSAASRRTNFYQNKAASKRKRVSGLNKTQKRFISQYNRLVERINTKYQPRQEIAKIGAKQLRAAMSRGESFSSWKKRAIDQGIRRAVDLPKGESGRLERHALAKYIRAYYPAGHPARAVASYIDSHIVSQGYLQRLHDLAYRQDATNLNWNNALEEAKKSNQKIKEEIAKIKARFARL